MNEEGIKVSARPILVLTCFLFSITALRMFWCTTIICVCFSTPIETAAKYGFWTLQQYLLVTKIADQGLMMCGNKKKSLAAKSELYGKWSINSTFWPTFWPYVGGRNTQGCLYLTVCHMTILHYQFTHGINVLWHNVCFWTPKVVKINERKWSRINLFIFVIFFFKSL